MKSYTGFEYLLIDAANQMGLDKLLFEQRIEWAMKNFDNLENLVVEDKTAPQFKKAVMAIRAAQRGEDIGHLVGLDASCSGMQIMSALTGCYSGCVATNLINTGVRQDAYTLVTDSASSALGESVGEISRKAIKTATMTHLYASKAEPRALFGEDTPELAAFYEGINDVCPGANELLQDLIDTWQAYQEVHEWTLPDGFVARVKTLDKVVTRIEVDEMDGATFEYEYKVVCGKERDVKNAANVIHSIDAYILRCMERRCNYNSVIVDTAYFFLKEELEARNQGEEKIPRVEGTSYERYLDLYDRTNMADAVIFPHVYPSSVQQMETDHIEALIRLAESMRVHEPFEILTVHDEFKCHPNFCNHMRQHYINIFAEMADANIIEDIIHQITGHFPYYNNAYIGLSDLIRNAEYPLS